MAEELIFKFTYTSIDRFGHIQLYPYETVATDVEQAKKNIRKNYCWSGHWGYWRNMSGTFMLHRLDPIGSYITLTAKGEKA